MSINTEADLAQATTHLYCVECDGLVEYDGEPPTSIHEIEKMHVACFCDEDADIMPEGMVVTTDPILGNDKDGDFLVERTGEYHYPVTDSFLNELMAARLTQEPDSAASAFSQGRASQEQVQEEAEA